MAQRRHGSRAPEAGDMASSTAAKHQQQALGRAGRPCADDRRQDGGLRRFYDLPIRLKMVIGFGAIVLLIVAQGLYSRQSLQELGQLVSRTYDGPLMAINFARSAEIKFVVGERLVGQVSDVASDEVEAQFRAAIADIIEDLGIVEERAISTEARELTAAVRTMVIAWQDDVLAARRNPDPGAAAISVTADRSAAASDIHKKLDDLAETAAADGYTLRLMASEQRRRTILLNDISTAVTAIAGIVLALVFAVYLTRPLIKAVGIAQRVAGGDMGNRIETRRRDETGQLLEALAEMQQRLSERFELEHRAQHAQRIEALGTLAAGIAHDLNNALVPVVALPPMLAEQFAEESFERRTLGLVQAAGQRAQALVQQMVAFSRKDAVTKRMIDLGALVRDALPLMHAAMPSTIEIGFAPPEGILPVVGDPTQLHQVIVNLVNNAAQAIGDRRGTISIALAVLDPVATTNEGDRPILCLSVRDTGCGMDHATMDRIFEPFFTTKEVGKGTGLGLAVVHGIVSSHGGRIEVSSAIGEGAQFNVLLPLAAAMEAADWARTRLVGLPRPRARAVASPLF
jgi:signal transduction histidine kinase